MQNNLTIPFKLLVTDRSISFDVVFFSILLIGIPIVLITGPALPDIFLSLIALFFLIKSFIKKKWNYYKNPIVIGFLFFSFYSIIRSLFSDMPFESLTNEGSMFYFRYIFFAMGVWYLLDNNPYLSKCLLFTSVACLIIICINGLYQYLIGFDIFGNPKHSHYRLTVMFGNEPILGRYIAYLSLFTFTLLYQNFNKTKKMMTFSIAFLIMCEVIVFLSGERIPLFYIFFFSLIVVIFAPHYRIYRILGVFVSVIILFGIIQINPAAKSRMIDHTLDQISETKIPYLPYSKSYENHYLAALKIFIDKPVFGVGPNTYRFQCNKLQYSNLESNCNTHPHNFYIQVLAELGIVGFSFIFAFFLYLLFIGSRQLFFILLFRKSKQLPFDILLYPMILLVYWWPLIPHMSFYNNWDNVTMMLSLGFFMKYFYAKKK